MSVKYFPKDTVSYFWTYRFSAIPLWDPKTSSLLSHTFHLVQPYDWSVSGKELLEKSVNRSLFFRQKSGHRMYVVATSWHYSWRGLRRPSVTGETQATLCGLL